ncbi:YusW family protein [Sporosarcina sp. Te-1]|uniref:YusW family protein n=1 Tax=Sporosarcina sp. Te-1 TaxID=2818390 RepID=UPI001A9FC1A4|nr:YusW family protein [Sporosarcina sp. Te-1]QTD40593.1 hypothetical protein J3U78_17775 [Sporosarcina sp. Te-1]
MKKILLFGTLLLAFALVLGACGNKKDDTQGTDPSEDSVQNVDDQDGGTMNTGNAYGFDNFDLEIEVDGQEAIQATYKMDKELEAIYINQLTGVDLKDEKAMNELDKFFKELLLTKDTSKKQATDDILKWYGIDGFTKFDLDVDFDDGNNLDIEEVK